VFAQFVTIRFVNVGDVKDAVFEVRCAYVAGMLILMSDDQFQFGGLMIKMNNIKK